MKSYLSLVPISSRAHRRQDRSSSLCISIAVFLVTAVFSMAEMGVRMEWARIGEKHGIMKLSDLAESTLARTLFLTAAAMFIMVLLAGVFMISGSLASSVAGRTKYFGMLRCIGMTERQTFIMVLSEALSLLARAVPAGLAAGVLAEWLLCAVLRFFVGDDFKTIPVFGVSVIALVCGIICGAATVLLAALSPAKKAASVSPIAALSGNIGRAGQRPRRASLKAMRVETALGVYHAVESKRNLILMAGSFALSVILFLCFSVLVEFVGLLVPQSHSDPDINIMSRNRENDLPPSLYERLLNSDGAKEVYARRSILDVPATVRLSDFSTDSVDIISFDDYELKNLKKDKALRRGSHVEQVLGDSSFVLATWDPNSPLNIGDTVQIGDNTLTVAGLLKNDPFYSDGMTHGRITLIPSSETFVRLTGVSDYRYIIIQLDKNASEKDVEMMIKTAEIYGANVEDMRELSTKSTYFAFVFCIYTFLSILVLVTVLSIVNSISLSAAARTREYGIMRAVGLNGHQMTKMIAAEALTWSFSGCFVGCIIGLFLHRLFYITLISSHFEYALWSVPLPSIAIIAAFILLSAAAAVRGPSKRLRRMPVTDAINDL